MLDKLSDGSRAILKLFRKWWEDGTSCLDIMKYVRMEKKDIIFYPIQHIQISWSILQTEDYEEIIRCVEALVKVLP